jgi:hypothetical protein
LVSTSCFTALNKGEENMYKKKRGRRGEASAEKRED